MATNANTRTLNSLVNDLRFCGYAVVKVGVRTRVTNPEGGDAVFLPTGGVSSKKDFAEIDAQLAKIGFTAELVTEAREKERQQRLENDRLSGERAMLAAQQRAAEEAARPAANPFAVTVKPVLAKVAALAARRPGVRPLDTEVVTEVVDLDRPLATALLEMNKFYDSLPGSERNRPIRRERVVEYAHAMLARAWLLHNQGIGVDVNGVLVDGQHRLLALILATTGSVSAGKKTIVLPNVDPKPKLSIPIQITWNLDSQAKYVVDKGGFRSIANELAMFGEVNANILGSVAKLVILYDDGVDYETWTKQSVSAAQILAKLDSEPELRDAVQRARDAGTLLVRASSGAGIHLALRAHAGGPMTEFLHGIKTGENLVKGDPRLALREYLLAEKLKTAKKGTAGARYGDSAIQLALFIKAWNDYVTGTRRTVIRLSENEKFPVPFVPKTGK